MKHIIIYEPTPTQRYYLHDIQELKNGDGIFVWIGDQNKAIRFDQDTTKVIVNHIQVAITKMKRENKYFVKDVPDQIGVNIYQ